ncbi:MAG: TRAP transporter small permease subunit [Pseudomonadota bacterium]
MIAQFERYLGLLGIAVACILVPAQVLVSLSYLTGRRLIHFGTTPLQELEWHIFVVLIFLSFGPVYLADRHVRIDVFREHFSERTRAFVELIGILVALIPFALALIYFGASFAWKAYLIDEGSRAALGLPNRWIIKSMIPMGGVLLLLAGIVRAMRSWSTLRSNGEGTGV